MTDLSSLPRPVVIAEPDYEVILSDRIAGLKARLADRGIEWDTSDLLSDPGRIQAEQEAAEEMRLRTAVNDAYRQTLLYFSEGAALDHLAAFYDVSRMAGETDERLKTRVELAIKGRSTGGPKERYQLIAMSADLRVSWAEPYRTGRSPVIHVAVFSTEADGVASAGLLDLVRSALASSAGQLVNDTIIVEAAVQRVVDLEADIWLLPDADEAVIAQAEAALRAAWLSERRLGRDLTQSWWVARLMMSGVQRVEPVTTGTIDALPAEAIAIGAIKLNLRGRAY